MRRHQSWQFSLMSSKNNFKELFPKFPLFSAFLIPHTKFKQQQVTGDTCSFPVLNEENHFFNDDHNGTRTHYFLIYLSPSTALRNHML